MQIFKALIFTVFLCLSLSYCLSLKGNLISTQFIWIHEKNTTQTIYLNGQFYCSIQERKHKNKTAYLELLFCMYNVDIKIYSNNIFKLKDKYDKYCKKYTYEFVGNKVTDSSNDITSWEFIKPLLVLYYLKRDYVFQTIKSQINFYKRSYIQAKKLTEYAVYETYNGVTLSKGYATIRDKKIEFYFDSNIDKKVVRTSAFNITSKLNAITFIE
ncbi:MAG: hypothetical protein ABDH21_03000 [bacterium]